MWWPSFVAAPLQGSAHCLNHFLPQKSMWAMKFREKFPDKIRIIIILPAFSSYNGHLMLCGMRVAFQTGLFKVPPILQQLGSCLEADIHLRNKFWEIFWLSWLWSDLQVCSKAQVRKKSCWVPSFLYQQDLNLFPFTTKAFFLFAHQNISLFLTHQLS